MTPTGPAQAVSRRRLVLKVLWWLMLAAALAGWMVFLRPPMLGGATGYVIVSGSSMEPMMSTGDLAIVRHQTSYGTGDVVAYRIPAEHVGGGMLVIHRVIGGDETEGLLLQGDNRDYPDMWRPHFSDVIGSVRAHVPHAGTLLFLFRSPLVVATAAGLLGFWFIVLRGDGKRVHKDQEPDPAGDADEAVPPRAPVPQPLRVPTLRSPRPRIGATPSYGLLGAAVVGMAIGMAWGGPLRR